MIDEKKIKDLIEKTKKMEHGEKLDLSSDQDLSIAVMNLISIEEHLFFSGGKTGKTKYFDLINEVREMRKQLLKKLIKDYEGEGWCIGKHLLAASMRLMEVATKLQTKGEMDKANELFNKAYHLYNLFWGMNLGLINPGKLQEVELDKKEKPIVHEEKNLFGKLSNVIGKILDCCRE